MTKKRGSSKRKSRDFGHELGAPLKTPGFIDRLDGLSYRYAYTYRLVKYLKENSDISPDVLRRITECYNWAVGGLFHDLSIGPRIFKSNACKQHRLCANCASLRAKRNAMNLAEVVLCLMNRHPGYRPIFTTITIKNGPDILERFLHLMNCFKKLQKIRTHSIEGQRQVMRGSIIGGLFSCEIKRTLKQLWHPHLHGIELAPMDLDLRAYDTELEETWLEITGDSKITRVKEIRMDTPEILVKSCMEVCKYSMKQAGMTPALQFEAYKATHNKQLVRRFGVFRGFTFDEGYEIHRLQRDLSRSAYQEFLLKRVSDEFGTHFKSYMGKEFEGFDPVRYSLLDLDQYSVEVMDHENNAYSLEDLWNINWNEM